MIDLSLCDYGTPGPHLQALAFKCGCTGALDIASGNYIGAICPFLILPLPRGDSLPLHAEPAEG